MMHQTHKKLWSEETLESFFFEFIIATTGIDTTLGWCTLLPINEAGSGQFLYFPIRNKMLRLFNCLKLFFFLRFVDNFKETRARCEEASMEADKQSQHIRSSPVLIKYLNSICLVKQKGINQLLAFVIVAKRFMFF